MHGFQGFLRVCGELIILASDRGALRELPEMPKLPKIEN